MMLSIHRSRRSGRWERPRCRAVHLGSFEVCTNDLKEMSQQQQHLRTHCNRPCSGTRSNQNPTSFPSSFPANAILWTPNDTLEASTANGSAVTISLMIKLKSNRCQRRCKRRRKEPSLILHISYDDTVMIIINRTYSLLQTCQTQTLKLKRWN